MEKKKWIFFDAMGVIFVVGDDTNDLLVPFIQKKNEVISKEYINQIYMDASLGNISSNEFWKLMNIQQQTEEELCREYLESSLVIDENFIEIAKRLKKNYNLAILSNDVSEWSIYLRNKFGLNNLVEFVVISGDFRVRKPSDEIYQIAIKKTGAKASDCIFIDDRDKNLLPAKKLGMNVIKYNREADAKTDIVGINEINTFLELESKLNRLPK